MSVQILWPSLSRAIIRQTFRACRLIRRNSLSRLCDSIVELKRSTAHRSVAYWRFKRIQVDSARCGVYFLCDICDHFCVCCVFFSNFFLVLKEKISFNSNFSSFLVFALNWLLNLVNCAEFERILWSKVSRKTFQSINVQLASCLFANRLAACSIKIECVLLLLLFDCGWQKRCCQATEIPFILNKTLISVSICESYSIDMTLFRKCISNWIFINLGRCWNKTQRNTNNPVKSCKSSPQVIFTLLMNLWMQSMWFVSVRSLTMWMRCHSTFVTSPISSKSIAFGSSACLVFFHSMVMLIN